MKSLTTAALVLLYSTAADAAVVRYDYSSHLSCIDGCYIYNDEGELELVFDATISEDWTGSLTFDTALFPGGKLPGAEMDLTWEGASITDTEQRVYSSAGESFHLKSYGPWEMFDWSAGGLIEYTGIFVTLLGYTVADGWYGIRFDEDGNVAAWGGWNMTGGSDDPYTSTTGDGRDWGIRTSVPGTWTRTILSGSIDPSPVPLPSTAISLFAGMASLAGVGAVRRRKKPAS